MIADGIISRAQMPDAKYSSQTLRLTRKNKNRLQIEYNHDSQLYLHIIYI